MSGLSRISIEQQLAAIGIETTPAKMNIYLPRLLMKIRSENAKMSIDRKIPTFRIDRKKLNSETGMKTTLEMAKAYRDKGKAGALNATSAAVGKGNTLGDVRRRGNRVAQYSRRKTLQSAVSKKINIGLMPKSKPELSWDPGYTKIHWSRYSISIDWDGEYMPQITIDPKHSIEIFLREKPYFRVRVEEAEDPYAPGKKIDELL